MAEMEAVAQRNSVPIVHWETGRFLATLCRALDPNVLEVGTAIGYSTLHLAEQLSSGRVVTLEIDPDRAGQARDFWARAGVSERIELVEGDARETIPNLAGRSTCSSSTPPRAQYREYVELAEPRLSERAPP
jgi:predicted O-methyltransferase YrrM